MNEFENKGFKTFNSEVKCWKLVDQFNKFEIIPYIEAKDSEESPA